MLIVHEEWLIFWKNRHRQGEGKSGTTEKLSSDDTPIAVLSATFTPLHATAYVTLRFVFALAHFKSMNSTYKSSMQNLVTLANHTRQATLTPHVSITHRKEHSTCFKTYQTGSALLDVCQAQEPRGQRMVNLPLLHLKVVRNGETSSPGLKAYLVP